MPKSEDGEPPGADIRRIVDRAVLMGLAFDASIESDLAPAKRDARVSALLDAARDRKERRSLPGGVVYDNAIGPGRSAKPALQRMTPGMWQAVQRMPLVKLEHAISVSLNLDPHNEPHGDAARAFQWRLDTAEAHRAAATLPGVQKDSGWWMDLAQFGAWAASLGWPLPAEMPRSAVQQGRKRHNWKAPGALAEMAEYLRVHGEKATAEKYNTSASNIRNRLAEYRSTKPMQATVRQIIRG